MVKVDVVKLGRAIESYSAIINNLNSNDSKVIQKFNDLRNSWVDNKSKNMVNSVNSDYAKIKGLNSDMKKQLSVYQYAYNKYRKLGKNIQYNNDNTNYIIHKLDIVSDQLEFVIEQFGTNNLGNLNWLEPNLFRTLYAERDRLIRIRNAFDTVRDDITSNMNYISNVEYEIGKMVKNIDVVSINRNYYEKKE